MNIDDALDGKLDMVRRFDVDVKALKERTKPHVVSGTAAALEVRPPVNRAQVEELHYDAKMLQHAEVFAWDEAMGNMVRESTKKFPTDIPFSRAWLYTPSGIWWFGRNSRLLTLRSTELDPTGGEIRRIGCALSFWAQRGNPENICLWGYSYDHLEPTRGPVPVTNIILKGGETLHNLYKEWVDDQHAGHTILGLVLKKARNRLDEREWPNVKVEHRDRVAEGDKVLLLKLAFSRELISKDEYTLSMQWLQKLAWIKSAQKLVLFFLAGSLWIQQKVLVYNPGTMTRHARKRAERVQIVPKVNVVELRRREYAYPPGTEGHKDVEWSCSWLVRGHWRNQFYPSTGDHKPIWIDPFVKGDPDKPFKGTERVFAVRR